MDPIASWLIRYKTGFVIESRRQRRKEVYLIGCLWPMCAAGIGATVCFVSGVYKLLG